MAADLAARDPFYEVPVVRLFAPTKGRWGTLRYGRTLARWLRANVDQYDAVCVSGLQEDACATIRAVGRRIPVVLRVERAGPHGDCRWQADAVCGSRIRKRCARAAALIAPSRAVEQELLAAGYSAERIHCVPNGVLLPPPGSASRKAAVRAELADAHPSLQLPEGARLAVCVGRLQRHKALSSLLLAWRRIASRRPDARLWLAGAGPDRAAVQQQIAIANLTGRVALVGVFDTIDELLAAADVFVTPSLETGTGVALMEAMAAGLPIVAGDNPGSRCWITDGLHGLLVDPRDIGALAGALQRLLEEPELAARLGDAARGRAAAEFSLARMAEEHVTLLTKLPSCESCRSSPPSDTQARQSR
jgi:glycosyltransferase involved in cell wall biosynthesis